MLASYGLLLPTHLPPVVEVPMSYTGPFTDEMHGGGIHDTIAPATMAPSPATKQDAMSEHGSTSSHHGQRHLHLDLSKRPHFLAFSGFNSAKAAHVTHPHQWPSVSYPTWPHFLAHSSPFHMTQLTSWSPPADVRQIPDCYVIEIEVPGLSKGDEEKVLVQWMSPRTVIVSAEIRRGALPQLVKIPPADSKISDDIVNVSKSDTEDGGRLQRSKKHSETTTEPKETETTDQSEDTIFLARERHAGYWRRSFTLPEDTNFNLDPNVSGSGASTPGYTLEAGVLSIVIPRKKTDKKADNK